MTMHETSSSSLIDLKVRTGIISKILDLITTTLERWIRTARRHTSPNGLPSYSHTVVGGNTSPRILIRHVRVRKYAKSLMIIERDVLNLCIKYVTTNGGKTQTILPKWMLHFLINHSIVLVPYLQDQCYA